MFHITTGWKNPWPTTLQLDGKVLDWPYHSWAEKSPPDHITDGWKKSLSSWPHHNWTKQFSDCLYHSWMEQVLGWPYHSWMEQIIPTDHVTAGWNKSLPRWPYDNWTEQFPNWLYDSISQLNGTSLWLGGNVHNLPYHSWIEQARFYLTTSQLYGKVPHSTYHSWIKQVPP